MQWQDLSFERAAWRIPQTKINRQDLLPLPKQLVTLQRQLPRMENCPYVFRGRQGHVHLVDVKRVWEGIRTQAGIPDVRIDDLRRTVGSWLAGSGKSIALIGRVLNHRDISTTVIYARLNLDPVRGALERNANGLLNRLLLAADGSGRVTSLPPRKKLRDTGSSQTILTVMPSKAIIQRSR